MDLVDDCVLKIQTHLGQHSCALLRDGLCPNEKLEQVRNWGMVFGKLVTILQATVFFIFRY